MGVVISPDSELGKELQKWEQLPLRQMDGTIIPAGNPYVYRPFPKMVYKAQTRPNGKVACMEPPPNPHEFTDPLAYERAILAIEYWNQSCSKIVRSEGEYDRARSDGWQDSPTLALEHHEKLQQEIAQAAAEVAHAAQRMTSKAKAELAATDAMTHEHVTDVTPAITERLHDEANPPLPPVIRRGRGRPKSKARG